MGAVNSPPFIAGPILNGTTGSVLFVTPDNIFAQDNSNFFWNNTTKTLSIGTSSSFAKLDVYQEGFPPASTNTVGIRSQVYIDDATAASTVYGTQTRVEFYNLGATPKIIGHYIENYNSGNANEVIGTDIYVASLVSTATFLAGVRVGAITASSVSDNYYGIYVAASGAYGIAIEAAAGQTLWVSKDANNVTSAAGIAFGSSRDTTLYRSAAGVLTTLGHFSLFSGASASELRLYEPSGSGTNYTAFKAQAQAGDITYTLPAADGTSGFQLTTNGTGTLSWASAINGSGTATRIAFFSAATSLSSDAALYWDNTNKYLGVGTAVPSAYVDVVAGTLTTSNMALQLTATTPTVLSGTFNANLLTITSAGSSAQALRGFTVSLAAGYTGATTNAAILGSTAVAGTGTNFTVTPTVNVAVFGSASASTAGTMVGVHGSAANGNISIGVLARGYSNKNNATAIGLVGTAFNNNSGRIQIGVVAALYTAEPTYTTADSAALYVDNGSQGVSIAQFRTAGGLTLDMQSSGRLVHTVAVNIADSSTAISSTADMPTITTGVTNAVSFNFTGRGSSANRQTSLNVQLNAGFSGAASSSGGRFLNGSAATLTTISSVNSNQGVTSTCNGTTAGTNQGIQGIAANGDISIGASGTAITTKNSGTNIGVIGLALNAGTTPTILGGYFGLQSANPTFASAALMCDNGAIAADIFVARDNGTAKFSIVDGGISVASSGRRVNRTATAISYTALTTDFIVGVTSTAAARTITLPAAATAVVGCIYVIKDESGAAATNNITVDGNGSETIDGATTYVINTNYGAVCLYTDGTAWYLY